jgi:hypothetical protein
MLEFILQLVAVAVALVVVAGILHAAFGQRYRFVVSVDHGEPRVTKGKVHADFVASIREICREYGIRSGWIGGVTQGKAIALRFSRSIPYAGQQRLRNVWFNS